MRTTSCCVVRGNYVIFFTKARCECLLPLPHGPPNPCQILPKLPERSKTAQGHPGALQETPRDGQKASPRASGSALEALWARLERHWGVQEVTLRGDFEPKMKIDSGNADFLKSMLSPRREHRKWGPEGPKMEPRTHPERSCEAKPAEEERKSA